MSSSDLTMDNWNPMAEDYSSKQFNSYNMQQSQPQNQKDMCSLYVKRWPVDLTSDAFKNKFSEFGKLTRFKLLTPKENNATTCGLLSYETPEEAELAMQQLDQQPPMNLDITYAKPNNYQGKGKAGNIQRTANDYMNSRNTVAPNQNVPRTMGRGRGMIGGELTVPIKVEFNGIKRVATTIPNPNEAKEVIPELISNPNFHCLSCRSPGELSCAVCTRPYCSKTCQAKDWKNHKSACKPLDLIAGSLQNINENGYGSEHSASDSDRPSTDIQAANLVRNNMQNQHFRTHKSEYEISSHRAVQNGPSQTSNSPNPELPRKQSTNIKANEIEDVSLPLNREEMVYVSYFQNTSKLWLQLVSSKPVLSEMEKKLDEMKQSVVTCAVGDVCCAMQGGAMRRIKIVEVKPNAIAVDFIDYGRSGTLKSNQICHLPYSFKKYPSQAICCKLSDDDGSLASKWNGENIATVSNYIKNKEFKVKAIRCYSNIYDVLLKNSIGTSLFQVAESLVEDQVDNIPEVCASKEVPSVFSNLKEGMNVKVVGLEFDKDSFWGLMNDNSGLDKCLSHIENLLETVEKDTRIINTSCEEKDVALGFSQEFKKYYRCVVLKRLSNSFLVRFIDYGNKEEIKEIRSIPRAILEKQSYVVCCTRPSSMSEEDFKNNFQSEASVAVKSVKNAFVELSFTHESQPMILQCFPWYHGLTAHTNLTNSTVTPHKKENASESAAANSNVSKNIKNRMNQLKHLKECSPVQHDNVLGGNISKAPPKIMKNVLPDKKLVVGKKYSVKMSFIKSSSEMYAQFREDEQKVTAMNKEIYQYSAALPCPKYIPVKDEVVCCLFSDDMWYRAQVLEKIMENEFKVVFVDYGNEAIVLDIHIKPLSHKFANEKLCACVSLLNVSDDDIKDLHPRFLTELWTMEVKEITDCTRVMLFQGQKSVLDFVKGVNKLHKNYLNFQKLPTNSVSTVEICYADEQKLYFNLVKDLNARQELQKKINSVDKKLSSKPEIDHVYCCRSMADNVWYRAYVQSELSPNTFRVHFIDFGNDEDVSSENFKDIPMDIFEIPVHCLAVSSEAENHPSSLAPNTPYSVQVIGEESGLQHIKFLDVSECEDEIFTIDSQLLPEELTEVTVCYIEGKVYYVQKLSDVENINSMMVDLKDDKSVKAMSSPNLEQLVCVKYVDGIRYRGLIKEKSGNDFKVFFVDYGNTDVVKEIYSLPSKYSLPKFCIPVVLNNENLSSSLVIDSVCKMKYTGKMKDNIQIVRVCLPVEHLLLSNLKTSVFEIGSAKVIFHSSESKFFYITKASDAHQLSEMKSMLLSFTNDEIYHVPSANEVLLVKSAGLWHRGCVKNADEASKECEVYLLDEGSSDTISFSHMAYVPKSIRYFPIFLTKVLLSPEEELTSPIKFGQSYTITVLEKDNNIPVIQVSQPTMFTSIERKALPINETVDVFFFYKTGDTLFLQSINDAPHINEVQELARKCGKSKVISHHPAVGELLCAQSDLDGDWYRCCVEEVVGSDKYRIHFIDYGNCEVVSKENLRDLPRKLASIPSFGIAVKIVNEPASAVQLEQKYTVTVLGEPIKNLQSVKLLIEEKASDEPKNEICKVTNIEDETIFCYSTAESVQILQGEQNIAMYNVEKEDDIFIAFSTPYVEEDLLANNQLIVEITEYCTDLKSSTYDGATLPVEGEMVLAKYDVDGQWYRAVVMDCSDAPSYKVLFTDFGNEELLHKDSLRKMNRKFMSLPIQAVPCQLTGFKVVGDYDVVLEEIRTFTIFVKPDPLTAIVIDDEDVTTLNIPIIINHLAEKGLVTLDF